MARWIYLLSFTIPASVAFSLAWAHEGYAFFALFYAFGILPALELLLPAPKANFSEADELKVKNSGFYDALLYLMMPIQYGILWLFCKSYSSEAGLLQSIGVITALGVACGVIGINVGHELGHRKNAHERVLARLLLASSLNWHFFIEHNRGHHKQVATWGDPESARRGESLYAFWIRSIRDSFKNAWNLDRREMLIGLGVEGVIGLIIGLCFGGATLLGFMGAALFGILLLQSVNYIEHYGLERKALPGGGHEPVTPLHSWNANQILSRAILFELSRHSDHHAWVSRKYPILRHHNESPELPTGYPGMILLALVPPLWRRIMHRRLTYSG